MRLVYQPLFAIILAGCTGAMVANVMPGQVVTVEGTPFTVRQTDRGLTVQNFETGATRPEVLINRASRAAELATGCTTQTIDKDGIANTYYLTMDCPPS
ncbi:MAG: hypothetical protein AAGL89_12760 [Pseudomonadota bacterium]